MPDIRELPKAQLVGRLLSTERKGRPFAYLQVPQALVDGLFRSLNEPGAELPRMRAHITVFTSDEIEQLGGISAIKERGKQFAFTIGSVRHLNPRRWSDVVRVWTLQCPSPELERLRRSYGLPARPNGVPFHLTFAVRLAGDPTIRKLAAATIEKRAFDYSEEHPNGYLSPADDMLLSAQFAPVGPVVGGIWGTGKALAGGLTGKGWSAAPIARAAAKGWRGFGLPALGYGALQAAQNQIAGGTNYMDYMTTSLPSSVLASQLGTAGGRVAKVGRGVGRKFLPIALALGLWERSMNRKTRGDAAPDWEQAELAKRMALPFWRQAFGYATNPTATVTDTMTVGRNLINALRGRTNAS